MPRWTLSLSNSWFDDMKNGLKTYEGRLARGIPKLIRVGDEIEIWKENNREEPPFIVVVEEILKGQFFVDLLKELPLDSVLPGIKVLDNAATIYHQFASPNSQWLYGVIFFKVKKIDNADYNNYSKNFL